MTTEKKPKTKPEPKIDNSMLLTFKMLQAQKEIEASRTKVGIYKAYEYTTVLPSVLQVTDKLNLRIKPTFEMSFNNEGKAVLSCKVDVINLDVLITKKTNDGEQTFYESEVHGTYTVVGDMNNNPKIECGQLYTYAYKTALLKIFNINEGTNDPDTIAFKEKRERESNGLNIDTDAIPNL